MFYVVLVSVNAKERKCVVSVFVYFATVWQMREVLDVTLEWLIATLQTKWLRLSSNQGLSYHFT